LHDFEQAEENLKVAMAIDSGTTEALLNHSTVLFRQGRWLECDWLLRQVESAGGAVVNEIAVAHLVLAVDRKKRALVADLMRTTDWDSVLQDSVYWKREMPDVLEQAALLLK
ncbi:MAG: hypothetical protein GY758_28105, partial [Fuerstiella sp.]|nr:hypothetical protein [Fuerstiella sp.]